MAWKKGESGNPGGRKPGTKNRFTQILNDFVAVWESEKCAERLREYINSDPENFAKFIEIIARLMPRQIDLDITTRPVVSMPQITLQDGSPAVFDLGEGVPEVEALENQPEDPTPKVNGGNLLDQRPLDPEVLP